jgi:exodeoxyribonuclease VII large subunit
MRLKRTVEDAFGYRPGPRRGQRLEARRLGHCYFVPQGRQGGDRRRAVERPCAGAAVPPRGRHRGDRHRQAHHLPGRSRYQIVVERLELAGPGRADGAARQAPPGARRGGLFDAARKQRCPFAPRSIGVVTSPTGAVIRDILHRLEDRFPTRVVVWPVQVQGETAAAQVAAAVRGFDAIAAGGPVPRPDLVIVARGGGSIEDLWAFNEEEVVRAVAACSIPTISAVGHETDTSLCDFAADVRAPTPTAAAEIAVPVRAELLAHLRETGHRIERCARRAVERSARSSRFACATSPRGASCSRPRRSAWTISASGCRARSAPGSAMPKAISAAPPAPCAPACSTPSSAARASGSTRCGGWPSSPIPTSRWRAAMPASRTRPARP